MKDVDFGLGMAVFAFVLFFAMMFFAVGYSETQKHECKKAAIEKNMTASDIQAVCR